MGMKTTVSALLLSICVAASCAHAGDAFVKRDADGNRVSSLTLEGKRLVVRDKNGDATSYFVLQGKTMEHRDMEGRRLDTLQLAH
jgi:hypothetical protein